MSSAGSKLWMHYDTMDNCLAQVQWYSGTVIRWYSRAQELWVHYDTMDNCLAQWHSGTVAQGYSRMHVPLPRAQVRTAAQRHSSTVVLKPIFYSHGGGTVVSAPLNRCTTHCTTHCTAVLLYRGAAYFAPLYFAPLARPTSKRSRTFGRRLRGLTQGGGLEGV
eukprot:3622435-Pyramimonas_sp.AAC.1